MTLPTQWPSRYQFWLRDRLTQYLITDVAEDDSSRAGLVKIGQLQEDYTRLRIAVEVHENDPDDDRDWHHNLIEENAQEDNRRFRQVIGGGRSYWNRRFCLMVHIFLDNLTREEATRIKGAVMHRIEQAIVDAQDCNGLTDSAGEVALEGAIVRENGQLAGDDTFPIWRYKAWIQYKTMRPRKNPPRP